MSVKVTELGCAENFICAERCRWKRHTQIGTQFRVSSIGNYYPDGPNKNRLAIGGCGSFFESMVFRTHGAPAEQSEGCGCLEVSEWMEIDGKRYMTAGEAQAGHEDLVTKYLALAGKEAS